jgi:hypothetical protein
MSGDRKRRARHSSREQVDAAELSTVHYSYVRLDDLPPRAPVPAKGLAGIRIDIYDCGVRETSVLEA